MDQTSQLVGAIGVLWLALSGLAAGAVRYLVEQRKLDIERCDKRIADLETRLEASSALLQEQAKSQQKQIDAQSQLIQGFQALLAGQKGTPRS